MHAVVMMHLCSVLLKLALRALSVAHYHGKERSFQEEDRDVDLQGRLCIREMRARSSSGHTLVALCQPNRRTCEDTHESIPRSVKRKSRPGFLPIALYRIMLALESAHGIAFSGGALSCF